MGRDREKKEAAQDHQIGDLWNVVAVGVDHITGRGDGFVDDAFRQLQREIEQRHKQDRHDQ